MPTILPRTHRGAQDRYPTISAKGRRVAVDAINRCLVAFVRRSRESASNPEEATEMATRVLALARRHVIAVVALFMRLAVRRTRWWTPRPRQAARRCTRASPSAT